MACCASMSIYGDADGCSIPRVAMGAAIEPGEILGPEDKPEAWAIGARKELSPSGNEWSPWIRISSRT